MVLDSGWRTGRYAAENQKVQNEANKLPVFNAGIFAELCLS